MTPEYQAYKIIKDNIYLSVATSSTNNKPWNTPVYAAYDENLNFYWYSTINSVHSNNIKENKNVFIVIYNSTTPEGSGVGLYIEANAYEISDLTNAKKGRFYIQNRKNCIPDDGSHFIKESPLRVYKAEILNLWLNDAKKDENGNYHDFRIKVSKEKIVKLLL